MVLNARLVRYPAWKVAVIAKVAHVLGMCVHIHGIPFGGHRGPDPFGEPEVAD